MAMLVYRSVTVNFLMESMATCIRKSPWPPYLEGGAARCQKPGELSGEATTPRKRPNVMASQPTPEIRV